MNNEQHEIPNEVVEWCGALTRSLSAYGHELYYFGSMLGPDRVAGRTKRGYGDDRVVAFAALLEIAGELGGGAAALLEDGRLYAASALLRQLVEVEYLLWAFSNNEDVARDWLQSDRDTLLTVFSPSAIRQHSKGEFRASEYQFHCNLGGHPSPDSTRLLVGHGHCLPMDVIMTDLASHLQRIWDRSTTVWQNLHAGGALVRDPPSLLDALIGEDSAFRHDHTQATQSGLVSSVIDIETGRMDITFVDPSSSPFA